MVIARVIFINISCVIDKMFLNFILSSITFRFSNCGLFYAFCWFPPLLFWGKDFRYFLYKFLILFLFFFRYVFPSLDFTLPVENYVFFSVIFLFFLRSYVYICTQHYISSTFLTKRFFCIHFPCFYITWYFLHHFFSLPAVASSLVQECYLSICFWFLDEFYFIFH